MKNKYIKNIDNSLLDSIKEGDRDHINHILKEEGFDIEKVNSIAEKNVKRILFLSKAQANKANDEKLVKLALRLKEGIEKGLEKPITIIKNLIATKEVSFQFRNLDRLSETEIKDIIKGYNLLSIIEDLEEKDECDTTE